MVVDSAKEKGHYQQTIKQCSANRGWGERNKGLSSGKLVGNVFFFKVCYTPW